jgi:hypothetical protein
MGASIPMILLKSTYDTWAQIPDGHVAICLPPEVSTPCFEIRYKGAWHLATTLGVDVTVSASVATPPQLAGLSVTVTEDDGVETVSLKYGSKTIASVSDQD